MATTAAGRRLTEQHRRGQLTVRARVLRGLLSVWSLFDPTDIDRSWTVLEPLLLALILDGRRQSGALAAAYYRGYRLLEGIEAPLDLPTLSPANAAELVTSLRVVGPVRAKQLITMHRPDVARQTLVSVTGAVGRHALNGGRARLIEATAADSRTLNRRVGWSRVTSFDPCAFCAMLASRGPVYSEDTADFHAHDACACTVEPMFVNAREAWPPRSREWRDLYNEATRDAESGDLLNAFRRAYEGRRGGGSDTSSM